MCNIPTATDRAQVVDHFRFLTDSLPAPTDDNVVASGSRPPLQLNYDARIRKGKVESSVPACIAAYETVSSDLNRWRTEMKRSGDGKLSQAFERQVLLEAVTPVKEVMGSTVAREVSHEHRIR